MAANIAGMAGRRLPRLVRTGGGLSQPKRNLTQLTILIKTRLRRLQYRPGLLDGFLASTRLDFSPFCDPTIKDR